VDLAFPDERVELPPYLFLRVLVARAEERLGHLSRSDPLVELITTL